MEPVEKVLTNLIDSMHKHIALGHGKKKVDTSKEIQKAAKKADVDDAPPSPGEETFFEKFLKSSVHPKNRRKTEIAMISARPAVQPAFKKKK